MEQIHLYTGHPPLLPHQHKKLLNIKLVFYCYSKEAQRKAQAEAENMTSTQERKWQSQGRRTVWGPKRVNIV